MSDVSGKDAASIIISSTLLINIAHQQKQASLIIGKSPLLHYYKLIGKPQDMHRQSQNEDQMCIIMYTSQSPYCERLIKHSSSAIVVVCVDTLRQIA